MQIQIKFKKTPKFTSKTVNLGYIGYKGYSGYKLNKNKLQIQPCE
jgi:uncharacterized membrane protein YebE (DUF533 family)